MFTKIHGDLTTRTKTAFRRILYKRKRGTLSHRDGN